MINDKLHDSMNSMMLIWYDLIIIKIVIAKTVDPLWLRLLSSAQVSAVALQGASLQEQSPLPPRLGFNVHFRFNLQTLLRTHRQKKQRCIRPSLPLKDFMGSHGISISIYQPNKGRSTADNHCPTMQKTNHNLPILATKQHEACQRVVLLPFFQIFFTKIAIKFIFKIPKPGVQKMYSEWFSHWNAASKFDPLYHSPSHSLFFSERSFVARFFWRLWLAELNKTWLNQQWLNGLTT